MEKPVVNVKVKTKLWKYDKGVDPKTGAPFEVSEKEYTLTGEQARTFVQGRRGQKNASDKER